MTFYYKLDIRAALLLKRYRVKFNPSRVSTVTSLYSTGINQNYALFGVVINTTWVKMSPHYEWKVTL